ncbi:transmembrane protein 56-like isoform X1 [Vigna unguiculata]|uniref:transmembrane protein 56-like isoform X1 n=1 Tax=Vigna unguiculata TaxID=3917 RepID=UPI0010169944|nr:transmembrane protein 56-like isoform X1 [Vigna unguiculata]
MESTSSFGSFSFYEYASPTKVVLWLASIFSGIIFCLIAYTSTAILSSLLIKKYGKLSSAEKIEWNNRGFSTFHALFVSSASFYLIFLSDVFNANSQNDVVITKSSRLSETVLGISIGYFLTDLAMILWNFPALGGLEYVLHHGLSIGSITLSLLTGQVHIYILMVLFSESTTPFVNLRWYLDIAGLKSSKLYIWNGIALFLGWLVARIFLFMFLFYHIWTRLVEVQEVFLFGFYTLIMVPSVLAVMNIFWFWKIAKGMIKTLTKAKHNKGA